MNYIIVGFGNIGHKRKDALGKKCITTIDPDIKKQADYKDSYSLPDKLLQKFSCVILAVPKQFKLELLEYWLSKGKHVLVEKPLVIDKKIANRLLAICKKNRVIWYTGYNIRFEPSILKLSKILKNNTLGTIYHGQMTYGYGNSAQIKYTWRNSGYGVLDEIGSHLIDLAQLLLNYSSDQFKTNSLLSYELDTFDHCNISTNDNKISITASALYWKNIFSIEIYGDKGSAHINSLCKWGDSKLEIHQRKIPAGAPKIKIFEFRQKDNSWVIDIKEFEKRVKKKTTSSTTDLSIGETLINLVKQSKKESKINILKKFQGHI